MSSESKVQSAGRSGGPPACRRAGHLARRSERQTPDARRFDFERLFRAAGMRAPYGRRDARRYLVHANVN